MRLFRRSSDPAYINTRATSAADLTRVSRLFRDSQRHYYGLYNSDLAALLAAEYAVVSESGSELLGTLLASWPAGSSTWLRGIAVASGNEPADVLTPALPVFHQALRERGLRRIYFAGDEQADRWLAPILALNGYVQDTDVIVYEKRTLELPSSGNLDVCIRPVEATDLTTVTRVDRACFEPHWTKDEEMISAAIDEGPLFVAAELGERVVGYAYATSHFSGRLVHLVRIAVDPQCQGQAIGVRLLAEVVAFARTQQAHCVTLNTQAYNTQAQRLYDWFGFKQTGERQSVLRCDLQ